WSWWLACSSGLPPGPSKGSADAATSPSASGPAAAATGSSSCVCSWRGSGGSGVASASWDGSARGEGVTSNRVTSGGTSSDGVASASGEGAGTGSGAGAVQTGGSGVPEDTGGTVGAPHPGISVAADRGDAAHSVGGDSDAAGAPLAGAPPDRSGKPAARFWRAAVSTSAALAQAL